MTGSMAEPLRRDPAEPGFTLPRGSLCWTHSENRERTRPMGTCVRTSTGSTGIRTEGRSWPGQPQGGQRCGRLSPTLPSCRPGPGPGPGCELRASGTHDVLGTDAEGPADDVQDFLHGDGHGSPELGAEEEESREILGTGSPT